VAKADCDDKRVLKIGEATVEIAWPIRAVGSSGTLTLVLLDPDAYLADARYLGQRRTGVPALRNLQAFSDCEQKLWEAEMPAAADYYYELVGDTRIQALSWSGYQCTINPRDGTILAMRFLK